MIIGHQKIVEQLSHDAQSGRLSHAQLFMGPKHVGKTRVALELAVILQEAAEHPVLRKQILEGRDPDTILMLDGGENLSIKEIRGLVERAAQSHARAKLIFIVENIGRMKVEAMNALLKTLEEPPEGTVFFLTAHREDDVIQTIRSRCHITHFNTVGDEALKDAAEGSDIEHLVMYAMGRPGKLKRLMAEPDYFEMHREMHHEVTRFLEDSSVGKAFELVRKYEKSENLEELLDILLHRTRTLTLSGQNMVDQLERIEQSKEDLRANVNKKLSLENLLLSFSS